MHNILTGLNRIITISSRFLVFLAICHADSGLMAVEQGKTEAGDGLEALGRAYTIPETGMEMLRVEPGTFIMGTPLEEAVRFEGPRGVQQVLTVKISKPFFLGRTEVTMEQWEAVMGESARWHADSRLLNEGRPHYTGYPDEARNEQNRRKNEEIQRQIERLPAHEKLKLNFARDLPMVFVSWYHAKTFCERLTARERKAQRLPQGYEYKLPTEAQWEYACRAGTRTATYAGETGIADTSDAQILDRIAWYGSNSHIGYSGEGVGIAKSGYRQVGTKEANAWGFHDMLGNVREWCLDSYGNYGNGQVTDPIGTTSGDLRVARGGSWDDEARYCRASARWNTSPSNLLNTHGFRVALSEVEWVGWKPAR
jgi:formylglycine-generating enzyme required for sulfatase activity